ncbi:acyltransferase family protein [Derxia lacustris]|uniref:acyltransferase family protein n=1 Tax=Derxia lacustris TaxID=764842 RepID=UPI0015936C55|nr:acyltransferase family protein [Derxia lacustris]
MRNPIIDIAKGLGIVLVVLGHNPLLVPPGSEAFRIVFSFHVPLFLFLAGVFFRPSQPLPALVRQKADALLKPYLAVALTVLVANLALTRQFDPQGLAALAWATGPTLRTWAALWFLPHLFLVFCLSRLLLASAPLRALAARAGEVATSAGLAAALLAAGVALLGPSGLIAAPAAAWFGRPVVGLPFSADLLALNTAFFLAGHAAARPVLDFRFRPLPTLAALGIFATLHALFDESLDLNLRHYGQFWIASAEVASGIYLALAASALLARVPALTRAFSHLGGVTLTVLIFHAPFQGVFIYLLKRHAVPVPAVAGGLAALALGLALPLGIAALAARWRWLGRWLLPAPRSASGGRAAGASATASAAGPA